MTVYRASRVRSLRRWGALWLCAAGLHDWGPWEYAGVITAEDEKPDVIAYHEFDTHYRRCKRRCGTQATRFAWRRLY